MDFSSIRLILIGVRCRPIEIFGIKKVHCFLNEDWKLHHVAIFTSIVWIRRTGIAQNELLGSLSIS